MRDTTSVVAAAVLGMAVAPAAAAPSPGEVRHAEIRVGIEEGDLRGSDHRALQAAVDYVAGLGGGTVQFANGPATVQPEVGGGLVRQAPDEPVDEAAPLGRLKSDLERLAADC